MSTVQQLTMNRQQLKKLAEKAQELADWTAIRDFADQMYGPGKVAKIDIDTYCEYNDEGGTDYSIESITAYDKEGNEVDFDQSLPFFESKAWKDVQEVGEEITTSTLREVYLSKEDEGKWITLDKLPVDDASYDLLTIPDLSLS